MKLQIKESEFETVVVLMDDRYNEPVCDLIPDGYGYYELPEGLKLQLAVGDTYSVVEIETEVD